MTGPLAITAADTVLTVGGRRRRLAVPATWWTPQTAPQRGAIWLQHGFARSRGRMADLARQLAGSGFAVLTTSLRTVDPLARTVQHLGDNRPFLIDLATALAGPELTRSWRRVGLPDDPPLPPLASGHSAGADAVAFVAAKTMTLPRSIAGVVFLDPVRSARGDNLGSGVACLASAGIPIRTVAAPPSRCNADGSGLRRILPLVTGFAGVLLTSGSHADAEGGSTDHLARWMCGAVLAENVSALRTLTTDWLASMAAPGPVSPAPGDPDLEVLTASGSARLLWGEAA